MPQDWFDISKNYIFHKLLLKNSVSIFQQNWHENWHLVIVTIFLLLILGSFLGMLTYRLPRILHLPLKTQLKAISIIPSHCPQCGSKIKWYLLIPILGFILQLKCKICKQKISVRYLIIELFTLLSLGLIFLNYQHLPFLELSILIIIATLLIAISIIDFEHLLILDLFSISMIFLGLIINSNTTLASPQEAIYGMIFGCGLLLAIYLLYFALQKKEGLGQGDIKFIAGIGAVVGINWVGFILLLSSILAIIYSLTIYMYNSLKTRQLETKKLKEPISFGTFLAISTLYCLLLIST